MVLGDNFPDVSNSITIFYKFNTSHMNFIQNEHIKFDKIRLDVQGHFKAYLLNVMDVLGHLTSKIHKNLKTDCKCYINSIKNLKTS